MGKKREEEEEESHRRQQNRAAFVQSLFRSTVTICYSSSSYLGIIDHLYEIIPTSDLSSQHPITIAAAAATARTTTISASLSYAPKIYYTSHIFYNYQKLDASFGETVSSLGITDQPHKLILIHPLFTLPSSTFILYYYLFRYYCILYLH